jgi:proteasome lid subunit RPN8/RPN11
MSLNISNELLERIREHGRAAYPEECCGLMLGRVEGSDKSVVALHSLENARTESRQTRYLIAPEQFLEAEIEARKQRLEIIGVYHSHPDHPARPSEFDREHAFPWYSYIIVNVAQGRPGDATSWILREDRSAFDSEQLRISQGETDAS